MKIFTSLLLMQFTIINIYFLSVEAFAKSEIISKIEDVQSATGSVTMSFKLQSTAGERYNLDETTGQQTASIDHSLYDDLLNQFAQNGLVDYAALKENPGKLQQYLKQLSLITKEKFESLDKSSQLAFLINLYNAATLKLIVDNYPVESIKDTGGFFKEPWDKKLIGLFGNRVTLDTIEHEIIRKDYDEPRIHMALVCAAMSCPTLRNEPYTGDKLVTQLNEQSKKFLNSKKGLQIDRSKKTIFLSSIFKWFGADFVNKYAPKSGIEGFNKTEQAVINFISRYVSEDDQKYLQTGNYSIEYLDYDWSLNERQMSK